MNRKTQMLIAGGSAAAAVYLAIQWALRAPEDVVARQVFNVVGENYQKKQLIDLVQAHYSAASIRIIRAVPDARDYRVAGNRIRERGGFAPIHTIDAAFTDVADAVRAGVFRDPRCVGHSAAPAVPHRHRHSST